MLPGKIGDRLNLAKAGGADLTDDQLIGVAGKKDRSFSRDPPRFSSPPLAWTSTKQSGDVRAEGFSRAFEDRAFDPSTSTVTMSGLPSFLTRESMVNAGVPRAAHREGETEALDWFSGVRPSKVPAAALITSRIPLSWRLRRAALALRMLGSTATMIRLARPLLPAASLEDPGWRRC